MLTKKEVKERRMYIGGSDVPAILNLDYGCARNLWYEKRGTAEDYPFLGNHHTERGNALEPLVIKMLKKKYKYSIGCPKPRVSNAYPFMRGNIDGLVVAKGRECLQDEIVLEVKCPSMNVFQKIKREGVLLSWIVQAQHYMYVWDVRKALFAIFNAELWELLTFDITRDEGTILNGLIAEEQKFWKMVQEGTIPKQLPEGDKRCKKCTRRKVCGRDIPEAIDQAEEGYSEIPDLSENIEYSQAVRDYINADEVLEEAEALKQDARTRLEKIIGDRPYVRGAGVKISYMTVQSYRIDTKLLEKDMPEILGKYRKAIFTRPFRLTQIN